MIADSKKPAAAPQPAPSGSEIAAQLAQVTQLRDSGALTTQEFEDAKNRILED